MVKAKIVQNEGHLALLMTLTSRSIFQGYLNVKVIFLMKTPTFNTDLEKRGKCYVRKNILKFVIRWSNQSQMCKKRLQSVYLYLRGFLTK